jgi:uncharacterized protein YoxC
VTFRRLTRILHLALVVSAIFTLTAFGVLLVKANRTVTRLNGDLDTVEAQSKQASHTLGLILLKAAVATDQIAKLSVVEQTYWREQNKQMAALFVKLNQAAASLNQTVEDADGAILESTQTIKALRADSQGLFADARGNLQTLQETQGRLNKAVDALDLPHLGKNVNLIAEQGVEISRNVNGTTGHLNKISGDAQYEADRFVAPRTFWQKTKGFLSVAWRVGAFVAIKAF